MNIQESFPSEVTGNYQEQLSDESSEEIAGTLSSKLPSEYQESFPSKVTGNHQEQLSDKSSEKIAGTLSSKFLGEYQEPFPSKLSGDCRNIVKRIAQKPQKNRQEN